MASDHPGFGVMIGMLGGNKDTVEAVQASIGQTIVRVSLRNAEQKPSCGEQGDALAIEFSDGKTLTLWDGGQSCCESRYMVCGADLAAFVGAKLVSIEVRDGPPASSEYGAHETQFLNVITDKGVIDAVTHNEHNGYYGGFWIQASYT